MNYLAGELPTGVDIAISTGNGKWSAPLGLLSFALQENAVPATESGKRFWNVLEAMLTLKNSFADLCYGSHGSRLGF
jgi:hypothetical protein